MGVPIHKRKFYSFISHAYTDKRIVDQIESWLTDKAGLSVWSDTKFLSAGSKKSTELNTAIEQCRSAIIILSKNAVKSGWVQEQFEVAIGQQSESKGTFRIIPIRVDECDIPDFLQAAKCIDISKNGFDLSAASELLLSLHHVDAGLEIGKTRDVYVSRSWHDASDSESKVADLTCDSMARMGFRLIGDSPDQHGFSSGDRVREIISSCGGLVAIFPDRGGGKTSRYVLEEVEIAADLNLPYIVVFPETVEVPTLLTENAIEVLRINKNDSSHKGSLLSMLDLALASLSEQWKIPSTPHYIFYATDLKEEHKERIRFIRRLMQTVSAMPCLMGEDIRQGQIQKEIVSRITGAFMMLADVSEDNLNTCIEAGIAIGANVPLHLVAGGPRHKPPFMFRDQQVWYYENDVDLLGIVHNLVYPYRRRVINYELQTSWDH